MPNKVTFNMPKNSLVQVCGLTDGAYTQTAVITGLGNGPITLQGAGMQQTMPKTPFWSTCPGGVVTVTITNSGPTPQSSVLTAKLVVGGGAAPSSDVSTQLVASEDATDADYNDCVLTFTSFVRR